MSREVDLESPLSPEDKIYLIQRGREHQVRQNESRFGNREASLEERIEDLRSELAALEAQKAAQDLSRAQQDVGVVDNTVVNGEGGEEPDDDGYDAMKADELKAEIGKRNKDREPEDRISMAGTKAQLIERLREDDADEDEEDEDEG